MICNRWWFNLPPLSFRFQGFRPIKRQLYIKRSELYNKCCRILGVEPSADQNTVRSVYIELVKKFHPDSGDPEASAERFQEVDEAFRVLQEKFAKNRRNIDDEDEKVFDIRHTAPQHRQYLNFDGVGMGNPFQRQKQYEQVKVFKAQERVLNHRIEKSQAGERSVMKKSGSYYTNHAIKTKYGIERVVEDLIQEAMSKGDFNKLSGVGKPLTSAQAQNPYLDFTTHKLNKILIDNGFTPEWITLQREIRVAIKALKKSIKEERAFFGEYPFNGQEQDDWECVLKKFKFDIREINKSIDKYNLIVPIIKNQMFRLNLVSLSEEILSDPNTPKNYKRQKSMKTKAATAVESGKTSNDFLSFLGSLF